MVSTEIQQQLQQEIKGEVRFNEPMSAHTSWRIGGEVDCFFRPQDIDDLCTYFSIINADEPIIWTGLGSNLLVRDGGIRGHIINTKGVINQIKHISLDELDFVINCDANQQLVYVEAGVPCAKLARMAVSEGLVGAEFYAGIPGTMGGALAMNAGAWGGETWNTVAAVKTVGINGKTYIRTANDYDIGYRHVKATNPDEWFIAAYLKLDINDDETAIEVGKARIKELLDKRSQSQPTNQANAGSVFRNPEGDFAARLIEVSGLKGKCINQACISEKHANFIINQGGAKAADVEALITLVQQTVKEKHNVVLEPEVKIIGEAA